MSCGIHEITGDHDFLELMEVEFAAFEDPPNPLRPLFFPILGTGPEARAHAIRESADRVLQRHKENPASHWVKAVDRQSGKLIGAALWMLVENDPYTSVPWPHCWWWPAGEGRDFANQWSWGIRWPRVRYMSKPHGYLNLCFVHPDFRRRGIGKLLLGWGLGKADQLGLETYIDAADAGRPLYESFGFVAAPSVTVDFTAPHQPGPLWKQLQAECLPFRFWPMWRPVQGIFVDGSRVFRPAQVE